MKKFIWLVVLIVPLYVHAEVSLNGIIEPITKLHPDKSGIYVLEKGGEALIARGWLSDKARKTIDVQYFIWSSDNVGILATEALLRAADRGVHVRVLVDDLLIDVNNDFLYALATHANIDIKIYNPMHSVGVSVVRRLGKMLIDFRGSNQRMHNKMFIVDGLVTITGGRNMSAEYFDFGHKYNYRDRDAILIGPIVEQASQVFEEFWSDELSVPVEELVNNPFSQKVDWRSQNDWGDDIVVNGSDQEKWLSGVLKSHVSKIYNELHQYALDEVNYLPQVRASLNQIDGEVENIIRSSYWVDAYFISDRPGKNNTSFNFSMDGGGDATTALANLMRSAKNNVLIQSPYLVLSDEAWKLFKETVNRGVKIKINTNSLSSSDNLPAYSGYSSQVDDLLEQGIELYEYRHDAARRTELVKRYTQYKDKGLPVFSLHAKTMVVDDSIVYIGTFNLDPRSENLNTEVGVVARSKDLARAVKNEIEIDMKQGNSWNVRTEGHNNDTSIFKRSKLMFWRILPIEPIL